MTQIELVNLVKRLCPWSQMSADEFLLDSSDLQDILEAALTQARTQPAQVVAGLH